jgi:hypothetical protein
VIGVSFLALCALPDCLGSICVMCVAQVTEQPRQAGVEIMQGDFLYGGYFKGSKNAKDPACSAVLGGGSAHTSGHPTKPQCFQDSLGGNAYCSRQPPNFWSIRWDDTVGDQCPTKGHEFNVMKHHTPCSTCHGLDASLIAKIVNRVPDNGQLLWVIGADGLHTGMNPTCIHNFLQFVIKTLVGIRTNARMRGVRLYCILNGIPPPFMPKKKQFAAAFTQQQNEEDCSAYNKALFAWAQPNVVDKKAFDGVFFVDPHSTGMAAHAIVQGDAIAHFESADGTHPGHMANRVTAQVWFNVLRQAVLTN